MEQQTMRHYGVALRKRWVIILIIPVLSALISGLLSYLVFKPSYQADTSLLVNQQPTNQQMLYDTVMANEALVNTYNDIIRSKTIENAVIQNLSLDYTQPQLDKLIQVSSPTGSEVIQITVTTGSQSLAVEIANELATVFQQKAQGLMNVEDVQIIDPAVTSLHPTPVRPKKIENISIAFIFGLLISIAIAFLLEYLDTHLRTEDDVRSFLDIPVLGSIMDYRRELHVQ